MSQILVVDDTVTIRSMIAYTLRANDYEVEEAVDGQDGLDKAQAHTYSLVLTDYNMPRMDGLSMVRAIRRLPEYDTTPIVVVTTEFGAELKQQGRNAGATGWMVKPVHPERLIEMVRRLIG